MDENGINILLQNTQDRTADKVHTILTLLKYTRNRKRKCM